MSALHAGADSQVVVQSVPNAHPYVAAVRAAYRAHATTSGADPDAVLFRPDPPVPGAEPGRWWPHPALECGWAASVSGEVDLVHVQFGFEGRDPRDLAAWAAQVRDSGLGLVLTVHDLVDPHAVDDASYARSLDVLLHAADAVTTLTPGAAAEAERRGAARPFVHPHPCIVGPERVDAPRPTRAQGSAQWVVSVHLKSLRANVDLDVVDTLVDAVPELPGGLLRLHVHPEVLEADHPRHDARLARLLAAEPAGVDVRVHPALGDVELWDDLLTADLAVLPYSRITHSGWLEMCHSLGTGVLAPELGFVAQQRPVATWPAGDLAGLRSALHQAHARATGGAVVSRPGPTERAAEAAAVARAHEQAYAQALAAVRAR